MDQKERERLSDSCEPSLFGGCCGLHFKRRSKGAQIGCSRSGSSASSIFLVLAQESWRPGSGVHTLWSLVVAWHSSSTFIDQISLLSDQNVTKPCIIGLDRGSEPYDKCNSKAFWPSGGASSKILAYNISLGICRTFIPDLYTTLQSCT